MESNILFHELSQYISKKNYINLLKNDGEMNCIPILMSKYLLMVLVFHDFMPYGYEIIPLAQITSVEYAGASEYFESIVKKEGAESLINTAPNIDIKDFISVFTFFERTGEILVVDIGKENSVNVGKVSAVRNGEIYMHCFSPAGLWDVDDFIEPFKNITGVQFRNHYTRIFSKYLPEKD